MNWGKIQYFKESEFRCRHCGDCNMDEDFVKKLDEARRTLGFPLRVSSGYRCPAHNAAVSSTGTSGPHTTGKAADILVTGDQARSFLTVAVELFPGIGVQQKGEHSSRFIHVDDLSRRLWSY